MRNSESIVRNNLIAFMIVLSFLFAMAIYAFGLCEKKSVSTSKEKSLKMMADFKIGQLSEWYSDEVLDIEYFSKDEILSELTGHYLMNANDYNKKRLIRYLSQIKSEHYYSGVELLTPDGKSLISASGKMLLLDSIEINSMRRSVKENRSLNTDIFKSSNDNKIYIDFATPIKDESGKCIASLICRKSLDEYINPLINLPILEKSTETYLVKKDSVGTISLYSVRQYSKPGKHCWLEVPENDEPTVKAAAGYVGILYGKDGKGIPVGAYISPIPKTPWSLVVKANKSELYGILYTRLISMVIIAILLILVMTAILYLVIKNRREKNYIELLAKETELRRYQERFKVTMDVLGEGVIVTDLNGKIKYLNLSAEEMTGWKKDAAENQELNEVFKIRNEQSGWLKWDFQEFFSNENAIKKSINAILVSKSGKEITVACLITLMK
ncbi:MAG: PAS domain S-box protein, partial [Bacteroidales bacterium]|nr:PAS domain S-box protein [Bacteroidales bacterium]